MRLWNSMVLLVLRDDSMAMGFGHFLVEMRGF